MEALAGVGQHVVEGRVGGIRTVLADAGQDFRGDPLHERLGFGLAGAEDQGVQAGFVDEEAFLTSGVIPNSLGVDPKHLIFIKNVFHGVCANLQHITHVLGNEPRVTVVVGQGAEVVHPRVVEKSDFHFIFLCYIFFITLMIRSDCDSLVAFQCSSK